MKKPSLFEVVGWILVVAMIAAIYYLVQVQKRHLSTGIEAVQVAPLVEHHWQYSQYDPI